MRLDIRLPIGLLFVCIGLALTVFGIASDRAIYARSLGYNVNLWWGLVILLFGGAFTWFGVRAAKPSGPPADTPEDTSISPGA